MAKKTKKQSKENKVLLYSENMTVSDIAQALNLGNAAIVKKLINLGIMANVNQVLDKETAELLAIEAGYDFKLKKTEIENFIEEIKIEDKPEDLKPRAPIVTVMGHVDHGKTTLLDTIRSTRVAKGEAGGITQHIGAYQVERKGRKITFIDTPGHAAFSQMRARGAQITDIVILIVAADEGVRPQTIEAIDHAKAAKVPIIVAVNKMDRPNANPDQVLTDLSKHGILTESWGGDIPVVKISAIKNKGIDELLDIVELLSDLNEYKANPDRDVISTVIEARLDRGRGPVATVIIQAGTLKIGDNFVVGNTYGKVRTLTNPQGKRIKKALPSEPVEVTGLIEVPCAGDHLIVHPDEKRVREIAQQKKDSARDGKLSTKPKTLDSLLSSKENKDKELNVIIKTDVQGSQDAIANVLDEIDVEGFHANIIRSQVGQITESDIILAAASNAFIIGFNVRPTQNVRQIAKMHGVEIRLYSIIYEVQEDIEKALKGKLSPKTKEVIIGEALVRDIFKFSKVGVIAGSYVQQGVIKRSAKVRVIRNQIVIYEGEIDGLKRFKDDVKEVTNGYECGISIKNFNDIKVGDIIEACEDVEDNNA